MNQDGKTHMGKAGQRIFNLLRATEDKEMIEAFGVLIVGFMTLSKLMTEHPELVEEEQDLIKASAKELGLAVRMEVFH